MSSSFFSRFRPVLVNSTNTTVEQTDTSLSQKRSLSGEDVATPSKRVKVDDEERDDRDVDAYSSDESESDVEMTDVSVLRARARKRTIFAMRDEAIMRHVPHSLRVPPSQYKSSSPSLDTHNHLYS